MLVVLEKDLGSLQFVCLFVSFFLSLFVCLFVCLFGFCFFAAVLAFFICWSFGCKQYQFEFVKDTDLLNDTFGPRGSKNIVMNVETTQMCGKRFSVMWICHLTVWSSFSSSRGKIHMEARCLRSCIDDSKVRFMFAHFSGWDFVSNVAKPSVLQRLRGRDEKL